MARLQKFLENTKLLEFPGFRQTYDWNCGTTALNMILAFYGHDVNEIEIMDMANIDSSTGASIEGLKKVAKHYGLKFREGHFTCDDLRKHIDNGWPTLIMIQAWSRIDNPDWINEWDQGHYTVNIGYSDEKLIFADPISIKRVFLTEGGLNSRWHGWDDNGHKLNHWGMVFTNKSKYSYEDIEEME
jgi:ABC-type bacteriocin/lantibiotic exporter with double-glycine peptidase domain